MNKKVKEVLNESKFIDECKEFTCMVRRDMGQIPEEKPSEQHIPKQVVSNLSTLDKTLHLVDIPIIGALAVWIAKHSN